MIRTGMFFFFKQRTAYELRISDWSSDVCSSDLILRDSGKVSREALLGLDLHAAQDLDALRLRGARAVERFGEIADGVAAERHILDQSQDPLAIFDGNIVLALHIFRPDRPEDRKSTRLNSSH